MNANTANTGTVLVVDNTLTDLTVLFDSLGKAGFKVLVAEDGESAVQKANSALPDLILLDVSIPGMDGFETCRRLKGSPSTQSIPIILLTALTDTIDKVEGLNSGAIDFITKPFQVEEVLVRVKTHMQLQRLTRQLQIQNDRLRQEIQERRRIEAEHQRSQESLQRQTWRAELFAEIALKIRQSLQLEDILQTTVTEVQKAFQFDRALILQLLPSGNVKVVTEALAAGRRSVVEQNITDDCFGPEYLQKYIQGRIYSITDIETAPVEPCLVNFMRGFNIRAKLVVPIPLKQKLWGLLIAHQCTGPRQWTDFETELLQQLTDQIGIALTQAQLLEQETRQRQELARSNTELQQFAYVASHDLQEPLRMVTSYLQLLQRRYQGRLDVDADDFIAYAVDGATRMRALIDDLLTYSRIGTRARPFEPTNCSVIVEQAIADLQIAIAEAGASVTCAPLPTVMADPTQLSQLFQNLISNAIKFCASPSPVVQIRANQQDDDWRFAVQDNGIGIDPQYADRIFVIFQRLHGRTQYDGTGIGLAVCKKIVERHGGQIWVQSEPNQGSTFYFTIPAGGTH